MATAKLAKSTKSQRQELSLAVIRDTTELQPRKSMDMDVLREYSEAWLRGDQFPPVAVFFDGQNYWLADGFYRVRSARKANQVSIRAEVYDGDYRDAKLYSVGANATHGVRRTGEDKRKAIVAMLDDPEWYIWSNQQIAKACRVADSMVSKIRENSPGLRGHGINERIGLSGVVTSASRDENSGLPEATFNKPPVPMTMKEIGEKFARKIARHLRREDPDLRVNVPFDFGIAPIVTKNRIYTFALVLERERLYAVVGRLLLAKAMINPKAKMTIIGHFPKSASALMATLKAKMGIECQTPEQVLAS